MTDAPKGSPLDLIKGRMQTKREAKTLDVAVAGLDQVFVRYARKVPFEDFAAYQTKRKGQSDAQVMARLDFIVDSCVGVFAVANGVQYGMSETMPTDPVEWPVFDLALRGLLPDPDSISAEQVEIARALFAAGFAPDELAPIDGSILSHGDQLAVFCGYAGGSSGN